MKKLFALLSICLFSMMAFAPVASFAQDTAASADASAEATSGDSAPVEQPAKN